jgi:Aspartyl protease
MGSRNEESRHKFLESPNQAAMIRAIFPSDAFIPKQRSIKAKVQVFTRESAAGAQALIDSGATENFISPTFISRNEIPTHSLKTTKTVCNVDGTKNKNGSIEETANLEIVYFKPNRSVKRKIQTFLVLDLGEDDMILGYPFLQATNPKIYWTTGQLGGMLWAFTDDAPHRPISDEVEKKPGKIKSKINKFTVPQKTDQMFCTLSMF